MVADARISDSGSASARALRWALFIFSLVFGAWLATESNVSEPQHAVDGAPTLGELPRRVNEWIEVTAATGLTPFYRTDHGGAVYDPNRHSVFLFGSDEHLRNFDNRIFELDLGSLRWRVPYERTPRYLLQTDSAGVRVAGGRGDRPWPMHVYDSMVYDRARKRLVVLSGSKHSFLPAPGAQLDPVWSYDATENRWAVLGEAVPATPNFFAAGAAYDPTRDTIMGYGSLVDPTPFVPLGEELFVARTGVWELGPDRTTWKLASAEVHHRGWFNVEFDVANRALLVLGGDDRDSSIWVYRVGSQAGNAGRWERRQPDGDSCPGGHYFPAAYDRAASGTLYMPYDATRGATVTCFYDAATNVATRLDTVAPSVVLNYTMVYVEKGDYFLLISGSFSRAEPARVWMLTLNLDAARRAP